MWDFFDLHKVNYEYTLQLIQRHIKSKENWIFKNNTATAEAAKKKAGKTYCHCPILALYAIGIE